MLNYGTEYMLKCIVEEITDSVWDTWELGSVPGSGDNVQPDTGEVTLDCFYNQTHISQMFHSPPYSLSLTSGLMRLGFKPIQTIIILLPHKDFSPLAYLLCRTRMLKHAYEILDRQCPYCAQTLSQIKNNSTSEHKGVEDKLES